MTTKAALLAAAKKIVAESKRKTNPAKRKGTTKPHRKSQITGLAPSKRLVKRRKANTEEGYFPNPTEISRAYKARGKTAGKAAKAMEKEGEIEIFDLGLNAVLQERLEYPTRWVIFAAFSAIADAEKYASEYAKKFGVTVRVMVP